MRFVVIDVETANPQMRSICQIGVVGFEDGREVFADSTLIDPEDYFAPFNERLHGIGPSKVVGAPAFSQARAWIAERLQDQIAISHSAFDRLALRQAAARYEVEDVNCRWLDSLMVARRAWPSLAAEGYGLATLASAFGIKFQHHDALEDARAAGLIMLRAIDESGVDLEGWFDRCAAPPRSHKSVARTGDGDGPLLGEVVVITGTLSLPRQKVADLVHEAGGAVDSSVTKRTTLLVVGDQDVSRLAGKDRSAKQVKAEQLMESGLAIRIIQETDLQALIN
ncbi:exonuclease domain-containing protein [Phenylobacterium sp.]|jgi:DNA polymerase-3 subunit epsilon|uniref:exonuclease domain-containing protein n=1 Tax=Phenylobacterium sp. TaxID=1871053 RepID=UPI0037CC84BC